jgi:integrase
MNFPQPQPHDPLLIALIQSLAAKQGQTPPPGEADGITLRAFFLRHYQPAFLRAKPKSVELCLTALNHVAAWMGHDPTLSEITPVTLASFVRWLAARPGRSPKTASKNYRHLRAICGYAAQLELMPPIPRLRMPAGTATAAEEEEDVPAFTLTEIEAILGQAVGLKGETAGRRDADLWVALVLSLYNTALRIAAALSLRWADYDAAAKCFDVRRSTQKTKKAQCVGITSQTAAYVERLRRPGARPDDPIWPWPAHKESQRRLCRLLRGMMRAAHVGDVKGKVFHRFREACATELKIRDLEGTLPKGAATEQLGHSSERTTNDSYIAKKRLPRKALRHCDALQLPLFERQDDRAA